MPELLFELGCEELPATAVRRAFHQLADEIAQRLSAAEVPFGDVRQLGTPRRLIVGISDVADRQPDSTKDFRGPGIAAAFDASGNPTKALEGFCRGQGVDTSAVRRDGDYVWVTKQIVGRPTLDLLREILPEAVRSLTFDKTMRWGASRMRFARPIRWMLALFGGQTIDFEVEGVASGNLSRGHRFNAPDCFEAKSFDELISSLRERCVEPDPEVRRERIIEQAQKVASGTPDLTDALVDENVFLTEWPTAVEGEFKPEFMDLPDAVLITAMAKHERFFPVRDSSGRLTNKFVSIRNGGVDDVVRGGNTWVLNARFNDAKFFFDEDKEKTLDDFLAMTERMLFQEKLGTVRQRADRLSALCGMIASEMGGSEEEIAWARQAGQYAKADLTTGLVSELASLQGVIGGEYARREGLPEAVCHALACQYDLGKIGTLDDPANRTALCLIVADQLDKLVGYMAIGLEPTGSSDPFGLRRAATILIEASWKCEPKRTFRFGNWTHSVVAGYGDLLTQGPSLEILANLFRSRYEALFQGERYDAVNAAITPREGGDLLDPQLIRFRLHAMKILKDQVDLVQTATRPLNILEAAVSKGHYQRYDEFPVGPGKTDSQEADELWKVLERVYPKIQEADDNLNPALAVEALNEIREPTHKFFENTMVMADDPEVRKARLTVVDLAAVLFERVGNFRELVIE